MLNGINEEGLSNDRSKVKVKDHLGATTEDIFDFIKREVRKKQDIIMVHAGKNDITNNTKSFENYEKITDTIKSKLPNRKYGICNVVMRKDKPIQKRKFYRVQQQTLKILQQK